MSVPLYITCFYFSYFFYTRTRIGYYYHNRDIVKAREKYKGEGHTIVQPATYGSEFHSVYEVKCAKLLIKKNGLSCVFIPPAFMPRGI